MASLPSSSSAFTHLLALCAGVIIGKSIDADELNAYRSSAGENLWTRIRRQMKSVLVGGVVLGLIVKTGGMAIGGLLGNGGHDNSGGSGSIEKRAQ